MKKKEKIATYFGLIPGFYLLGILGYYELKVDFSSWILLIVSLLFAIAIVYWMYKRFYDTNIQSIKQSLEELKELKEE